LLLGLALSLRLPGLGYHEFHFDEVLVLTRAREAIRGEDDALARHTKGPGEIAATIVVYRALGTANETTARLPFGLASVASILALFVLGRRLFSTKVGLTAGLLLAANGFALGLSRIVQYQPAMLLLSILAVLAAWEFAQSGQARWLALAAVFSAFGAIMHYEFLLLAPLLALLAVMGWRRARSKRTVALTAWWSGIAAAGLVAAA
jgi:4-amino-4-deoxy-L-arabinose transferase-like glycosyltransferase